MKRFAFLTLTAVSIAFPAWSMEFTNLDHVEHHVLYEGAGSRQIVTVAPGETARLNGVPNGFVSLVNIKTGKKQKPSNGNLHSDGLLSGVVGAERSSNIPADSEDVFVIWQDGSFGLQQSRRQSRLGR